MQITILKIFLGKNNFKKVIFINNFLKKQFFSKHKSLIVKQKSNGAMTLFRRQLIHLLKQKQQVQRLLK